MNFQQKSIKKMKYIFSVACIGIGMAGFFRVDTANISENTKATFFSRQSLLEEPICREGGNVIIGQFVIPNGTNFNFRGSDFKFIIFEKENATHLKLVGKNEDPAKVKSYLIKECK